MVKTLDLTGAPSTASYLIRSAIGLKKIVMGRLGMSRQPKSQKKGEVFISQGSPKYVKRLQLLYNKIMFMSKEMSLGQYKALIYTNQSNK